MFEVEHQNHLRLFMLNIRLISIVLIYCCALVPLFSAIVWIYTFGFTDYRSGQAYIGLPLGIAMLALAMGMFALKKIAIIISMVLSALVICALVWLFPLTIHWSYYFSILVGVTFLYFSKQHLWPAKTHKEKPPSLF